MNKFKIISLTHAEDLDGIGSQAIIYRYFEILNKPIPAEFSSGKNNKDAEVEVICLRTDYDDYLYYWAAIFSQNIDKINFSINKDETAIIETNLFQNKTFEERWGEIYSILSKNKKSLEDISSKTKNNILNLKEKLIEVDLVIITDLGLNQSYNTIIPFLKTSSIKIAYFDHHEHEIEFKDFFSIKSEVYIVNDEKCAAQIVYYFLYKDDEDTISKEIMAYAVDSDFQRFELAETDKLHSIISRIMYDNEKLDLMMNFLANGSFWNTKIEEIYNKNLQWELNESKNLFNQIYSKHIKILHEETDEIEVEFIFGMSKLRPSRAIKIIEDRYEDFFGHPINKSVIKLGNNTKNVFYYLTLTLNSDNLKMNIRSNYFNVFKIAQYFGGGGHIERSGFKLPLEFINNVKNNEIFFNNIKIDELIEKIREIIQKSSQF